MFSSIEELTLSEEAREIVKDCPLIVEGPPQWDVILATHERLSPSTLHFPRTAEFTFANALRKAKKKRQVTIRLSGATEDFQCNGVSLVLEFRTSVTLCTYLYDRRRREGHLIDVNFLRQSETLQRGESVYMH